MRRLRPFILLIAFIAAYYASVKTVNAEGLAKTDWPTLGGNNQRNKISPSTNTYGHTAKFVAKLEKPQETFIDNSAIIIGNETIYTIKVDTIKAVSKLVAYDTNGNFLWESQEVANPNSNATYNYSLANPTLHSNGQIFVNRTNSAGLTSFDDKGQLLYIGRCLGTDALGNTPTIDSDGNVIIQYYYVNNPLYSTISYNAIKCDTQGNFLGVVVAAALQGPIAIDSKNVIYSTNYNMSDGFVAANTGDTSVIWRNADTRLRTAFSSFIGMSPDESRLYYSDSYNSPYNFWALDATNGAILWSKSNIGAYPSYTIGKNMVYIVSVLDNTLYAYNGTTGDELWKYKLNDLIDRNRPVVDSEEHIYLQLPVYNLFLALNGDGTEKWKYYMAQSSAAAATSQIPAMADNGDLFFASSDTLYGMKAWDADIVEYKYNKDSDRIEFSVETTMLQKDPQAGIDNKMQLYLDNGTVIPLTYVKSFDDKTLWEGYFDVPDIDKSERENIKLSGQIEAIAFQTWTQTQTHFTSIPQGFFNTGYAKSFDLGNLEELINPATDTQKSQGNWFTALLDFFQKIFNAIIALFTFIKAKTIELIF